MMHAHWVPRTSLIFAANLEKLRLAAGEPPPSQAQFAKRIGLQQRTYNRIVRGEVDANLSSVQVAADALHLQAWQLLVEDFDPAHPPELAALTERELAFYAQLRALAKTLNIGN